MVEVNATSTSNHPHDDLFLRADQEHLQEERWLAGDDEVAPNPQLWETIYTVVVLVVMFVVLISDRVGTDSVMLTALTAFYIAQIIDIKEALAGFSSRGLLTVLVLFVVAEGLNKTGALNWYVAKLLGRPKTPSEAQLRVMLPIAALSGFINDTPLVCITLPIVIQWAKKINVSTRYLLIPLSFASLLGGVCTIIGTSTNLVIVGLLQDGYPDDPRFQNIPFFAIGQYGVPVTFVGIAYVVLVTPWLLVRGKQASAGNDDDVQDFLLGARLTQWAPAAGRSIQRSGLRDTGGIFLVRVKRAATGNIHHAVGPEFILEQGDILYFTGLVESFGDFCAEHGLEVVTNEIEVGDDNDIGGAALMKDESSNYDIVDTSETPPLTLEGLHPISEGNEPIPAHLGTTWDSIVDTLHVERMRAIYRMEDVIRGLVHPEANSTARDRIIITVDKKMVVIGIETADRSGLLLDLSKCLARLQIELHHTEAAVKHDRSLSIWRCGSNNLSQEFEAEIYSVLHALLSSEKGAEAIKQRGLRVVRARVLTGRLVGAKAAQLNLRETYKAAIVAVQRNGETVGPEASLSTFSFAEGDVIVFQASDASPLLESPPADFYENLAAVRSTTLASKLFSKVKRTSSSGGGGGGGGAEARDAINENLGTAEMGLAEDSDAIRTKEAVWKDLKVIQAGASAGLASREFLMAVKVVESRLVGKSAADSGIDKMPDLHLISLERPVAIPTAGGEITSTTAIALAEPLKAEDILWYSCTPDSVSELRKIPGLISHETEEVEKVSGKVFERRLVQAVVARQGPLVGKTIKEARFRTNYGAAVIAVHREGKRVHEHPGNVKLHAGDVLLLEAGPSFMSSKVQHDSAFALVAEVENSAPPRMRMLVPALILTFGAYGCYMAGLSELIGCAMVAVILMVALGIISESEARSAIQWKIYLTIASAYGIGSALINSGVAGTVADALVKIGNWVGMGDAGLLGAVYLATVLISQVVANNAAAALIFPIAMGAAETSGIDLQLMSYTILLAASAAFMTPFGYQTNLMVMGPGGYSTKDFLVFGTPMQIVLMVTTVFALISSLWVSWVSAFAVMCLVAAYRVFRDRQQVKVKKS